MEVLQADDRERRMTKESMSAMPHLIVNAKMNKPQAPSPVPPPPSGPQGPSLQAPPAPQQAPVPQMPPVAQGPEPEMEKPKAEKGSFPIKLIASIQMIYASEQQKQLQLQGSMAQGMGLKPGWGGAG